METEIKPWGKFNQYLPGIFLAKRGKKRQWKKTGRKLHHQDSFKWIIILTRNAMSTVIEK